MQTITYVRKPLTVEAIQVTRANLYEVAAWAEGDVITDAGGKKFIEVKVLHPARRGHTQAYIGDWLLKSEAGYKIYADTAFKKGFDRADGQLELTREELGFAGIEPGSKEERALKFEHQMEEGRVLEYKNLMDISLDVQPLREEMIPKVETRSLSEIAEGMKKGFENIKVPHFDGKNFFSSPVNPS